MVLQEVVEVLVVTFQNLVIVVAAMVGAEVLLRLLRELPTQAAAVVEAEQMVLPQLARRRQVVAVMQRLLTGQQLRR
jgi:hypothetical protein